MNTPEPGRGGQLFSLADFLTPEEIRALDGAMLGQPSPTLYLYVDRIRQNYRKLKSLSPNIEIYYAVKACPHPLILEALMGEGSNFDIASRYELDRLLSLGCDPARMSYGNTIKKATDIAYAYEKGIRMYATDSDEDIAKLALNAPGSRVYFRILTPSYAADWPLSRKFGSEAETAVRIAKLAREKGLEPYGISFHVGSQQHSVEAWDAALSKARMIYDTLSHDGIVLEMINLGGGLPATYSTPTLDLDSYRDAIQASLTRYFGDVSVRLLQEPGRSLAGDIGIIVSEVVLVSRKSEDPTEPRWVYIDLGKFSGLPETLDEAIKYPFVVEKSGPTSGVILAGPTCDSADILYEHYRYEMPESLTSGDRIYIPVTGAYTQSYSAIEFNGFPPLNTVVIA